MAKIAWTHEAQRWLEDIYEFIAADSGQAAAETVQGIYEKAQVLIDHPEIGYRYWDTFESPTSSKTVATSMSSGYFTRRLISVATNCDCHSDALG